jgi:hypothetical protein
MRPAKIVAIVFGVLSVLIGLVLLVPGVFLLGAYGVFKDDAGFLQTSTRTVASNGYALVSPDVNLNIGPGGWEWVPTGGKLAFRLVASATNSREIFVGIGPSDKVADYLQGVSYDEITEYGWASSKVEYGHFDGGPPASKPDQQTFWVASSEGPGLQDLRWDILDGSWTAVIMNADASEPVQATMSLGARFDILLPIGIAITVVGVILLAVGIVLIVLGARRARPRIASQPPAAWGPPPGGWDQSQPQWQPPAPAPAPPVPPAPSAPPPAPPPQEGSGDSSG